MLRVDVQSVCGDFVRPNVSETVVLGLFCARLIVEICCRNILWALVRFVGRYDKDSGDIIIERVACADSTIE